MGGNFDADKTVRVRAPAAEMPCSGLGKARLLVWSGLATLLVVAAVLTFFFLTPRTVPITVASRAEILAARPTRLLVFRFRPDPRVVVLDFPTLHEQGEMLNRVAALIEKADAPRHRVLTDAELAAVIRASGATPDTYYYGHDYRASDLVRFFRLMREDRVAPGPEERRLRALMAELHWFRPGAVGALITLPAPGTAPGLDASGRATILEHEISHGAYFTIPAFDAYAHRFFYRILTEPERTLFRHFLAGEGYDTGVADLVVNETQAYLMFTPDPRFFSAALVGLSPAVLQALREQFWNGIPVAWLKQSVPDPATVPAVARAQGEPAATAAAGR